MRAGEPDRSQVIGYPETLRPLGMTVDDMVSLSDGVQETLKWYRTHLDYFRQPMAKAA
jgi:hypothetical protein